MNNYFNVVVRQSIVLLIILFATVNVIAETETHMVDHDCVVNEDEAQRAVAIMQQDLQLIRAGSAGLTLPSIKADQGYQLDMLPQSEVTFVVPPARDSLAEESSAGVVQFTSEKEGRYRININDGGWIDVLSNSGEFLEPTTFKSYHGCQPLRKFVEYQLLANSVYTLQLSGGTKTAVVVVITTLQ